MEFELSVWKVEHGKFVCTTSVPVSVGTIDDLDKIMSDKGNELGAPGPRFNPITGTFVVTVFDENEAWVAQVQANKRRLVHPA